jgi:hypothetical protein
MKVEQGKSHLVQAPLVVGEPVGPLNHLHGRLSIAGGVAGGAPKELDGWLFVESRLRTMGRWENEREDKEESSEE